MRMREFRRFAPRPVVHLLAMSTLATSQLVAQGIISTYAGTQWIFQGAGKSGLSAPLSDISTVTADPNGRIVVTDPGNSVVFRIESNGLITILAGNGFVGFSGDGAPAVSASLNGPEASVFDAQGNLYIADTQNNRIRMVNASGIIQTVAGTGVPGFAGDGGPSVNALLALPLTIAVDPNGVLYVNDRGNSRIRRISNSGTITTYSGNGANSSSGDGGPAVSASLNEIEGIALDGAGNLYLAEFGGNRVRQVNPAGTITTIAGNGQPGYSGDGGPATKAVLDSPGGVAIDHANNIYISDTNNFVIRKISAQGAISTHAGNGQPGFSGDGGAALKATFGGIFGLMADAAGDLYIADRDNFRIREVNSAGTISTIAGNGGFRFSPNGARATSAFFYEPFGVSFDGKGSLYIADASNNRVETIGTNGAISTIAGTGQSEFKGDGGPAILAGVSGPTSVTPDALGNLYIADTGNSAIRKIASDGTISTVAGTGSAGYSGDGAKASKAQLNSPEQAIFDGNGNLYISDFGNNRIRRVTTDGNISTFAGTGQVGFTGDGGSAISATFNGPAGMVFDGSGNLYVADWQNARIRRITPAGIISTFAGGGSLTGTSGDGLAATQTSLGRPLGLAIDGVGNIYLSDARTNYVKKVSSAGIISTVAGTGVAGYTGDGGVSTGAALNFPYGLAVDPLGDLVIADAFNNRIRAVLAGSAVTYQAAPSSLQFTALSQGVAAASQTVNLSTLVPGLAFSAAASAGWITVNPGTGSLPGSLQVSVDATNLAPGNYSGSVTITAPQAKPAVTRIPVSFTVQPPVGQPVLSSGTKILSFLALPNGANQTAIMYVQNSGSGVLNFSAAASMQSGSGWLTVTPASSTATPTAPSQLNVVVNPGSLAVGTYQGTVTVTNGSSIITSAVNLSISAPGNLITVSQSALGFRAVAQGGMPLPQTFGIINTGNGALNWSATSSTLSGGNSWLRLSPASGTVQNPFVDVSTVSAAVDPSGLAAGTYYGKIQISASAANSPQVMTVILTVLPAGSNPGPDVSPTGLIFTGAAGSTPGSQTVMVGNPTPQTNTFISASTGNGFQYLPTNADVQPSTPTTITVLPDFTSLAPGGVRQGAITLQFSDGSTRTVSILSVAGASSGVTPAISGFSPDASSCSVLGLNVQFQTLTPTFTATVDQPSTVQVKVTDNCSNLVAPNGAVTPTVSAIFSNGDTKIPLNYTGGGVWSTTWRPINPSQSVTVTVYAASTTGTNPIGGQKSTSGSVTTPVSSGSLTTANTPVVTAGGIVHAASYAAGAPLAPGGLITIYGANLASSTAVAQTLPLPRLLGGAQVLLGNLPLPLSYASAGQINVQVPFDMAMNTQLQLTVQRDTALSVPESLPTAVAQPGVFTLNQQGTGQGAVFKSDGVTLAQPGTPAAIGETVVVYCTGLGAVTPTVLTGSAESGTTASTTVNTVTVMIGGQPASVAYSGLTAGAAGLYQIDAVVPAGIATGDAVPLSIVVAQQTSPSVTIAVR